MNPTSARSLERFYRAVLARPAKQAGPFQIAESKYTWTDFDAFAHVALKLVALDEHRDRAFEALQALYRSGQPFYLIPETEVTE